MVLGQDNTGATARTELATTTGERVILADPSGGNGVQGFATGTGRGVLGFGGSGGGNGVEGQASSVAAAGVLAFNAAAGPALQVDGIAAFRRSGLLTIAAGASSGTVTGVPLSSASLVLATLQQDRAGVYVRSAVPSISTDSFTVHLSKAVTASITVAWFVVN